MDTHRLPILNFDRQYMNNTKIARIISTKDITADELEAMMQVEISVGDNVINLVDLWTDKNITLSNYNITQFDMAVMDAAFTILCAGNNLITVEWIAKVLSGNPKQRITEQKIKHIQKSMDKLACIRIKIDCQDELNNRKDTKGKIKKFIYESYLLPISKVEAKYEANGKEIIAYHILETPALYKYAELVHQIVDVPEELLETQDYFSDTEEAILIKRYIVKRVAQITSKNHLCSNKISFLWYDNKAAEDDKERGLFPELGYKPENYKDWSQKRKQINQIVKGTLDSLVDNDTIQGYKPYRKDGTDNPASPIMGYRLILDS